MHDRAVFIDRDGTLIVEKHYLSDPNDVELLPGTIEALKMLRSADFKLIVVTNQSAIARGIINEQRLEEIHIRFRELLAEHDVIVDDIYHCPHGPDDHCECRKPKTGMGETARQEHSIDLSKSFVIGDNLGDIGMGRNLGAQSILVRTGYGAKIEADGVAGAHHIVDDVLAAARQICTMQ